jgi:acyl-CoA hydrolase
MTNERFHTATAYLTFVALDSHGNPAEVAPVKPETKDEKRRFEAAQDRRDHRLKMREKLKKKS